MGKSVEHYVATRRKRQKKSADKAVVVDAESVWEAKVVKRRKSKQGYEEVLVWYLNKGGEAQEQDCPGCLCTDGLQEERTVHWPSTEVPLEFTLSIFLSLSGCECVRACAFLSLCFSHFLSCFVFQGFSLSLDFSLTYTHTHTRSHALSYSLTHTRTYAPYLYPHFPRILTHISLSVFFSFSLSLPHKYTHTHTNSRTHILSLLYSPTTSFIALASKKYTRCTVVS